MQQTQKGGSAPSEVWPKFTPSPTKAVRVIDKTGVIKVMHLNRRQRRRLGVKQ